MRRAVVALSGLASVTAIAACVWSIDDSLVGGQEDGSPGDHAAGDVVTGDQSVHDASIEGGSDGGAEGGDALAEVGGDVAVEASGDGGCPFTLAAPVRLDGGGPCPNGMTSVPIAAGGDYCVDTTEVTVTAYAAFLANGVPACVQPPQCAWNTDYIPDAWDASPHSGPLPIIGVDWCDAWAFCRAAGKRLCGRIGGGSVSMSNSTDFEDPTVDQWFNACSNGATTEFPYGSTYSGTKCNGAANGGSLLATDQPSTCLDTWGVIDLSGNVDEWEDSCGDRDPTKCPDAGPECDFCFVRGGSFESAQNALGCDASDNDPRSSQLDTVGFRCCAD